LTADLPPITSDVIIVGENTTVDGGGQYRIFYTESANITVDTLTIQNGYSGSYDGGGISTYDGKITVINSTLQGNTTQSAGGGISSVVGDVTIAHSKLISNAAVLSGGGAIVENGRITVTQSIFAGNSSVGCGAGIMSNSGTMMISSSTFSSNTVTVHGGGALCLASQEAAAIITNSTFSGNSSERGGGAVAAANRASVTLIASTIYNNRAGRGGGVWTDGTLILQQSIVAGNYAANGYDITMDGWSVSDFESQGYNLVEKISGLKLTVTDIVTSATGLGPLAQGVHVPGVDSLARNAIAVGECATSSDQRGIPRPQGVGCDIGAIEIE
jgi:predicted outer membrane repeat protein